MKCQFKTATDGVAGGYIYQCQPWMKTTLRKLHQRKGYCTDVLAVADLGGRTRRAPPLRSKIFLISCSFFENLTKSYVGAPLEGWRPLLQGILDPPLIGFIKRL